MSSDPVTYLSQAAMDAGITAKSSEELLDEATFGLYAVAKSIVTRYDSGEAIITKAMREQAKSAIAKTEGGGE